MGYYELLQEDPGLFIIVLSISIVLTLLVYGAFPIIFAKSRKTPITKKKYKRLCYGINIIGFVFFALIDGAASGGPYILWTWIFSNSGIKTLKKKGLLLETELPKVKIAEKSGNEDNQNNTPTTTARPMQYPKFSLSFDNEPQKKYGDYNVYGKDIAYIAPDNEDGTKNIATTTERPVVIEEKPENINIDQIRFCRKCGEKLIDGSRFCRKCGTEIIEMHED